MKYVHAFIFCEIRSRENEPMILTIVAAMDKNQLIGQKNKLPWHLPADLAHFKKMTIEKPIVMGRKTFESIGRPLPHRWNIVITEKKNLVIDGCDVFHSLDQMFGTLASEFEVMIIGGTRLFKEALPKANKMILTIINHAFEGDVYFPKWKNEEWEVVSKIKYQPDEQNPYPFQFLELRR